PLFLFISILLVSSHESVVTLISSLSLHDALPISNCSGFTKILATTKSFSARAALTRLRWPSCSATIVGTKAMFSWTEERASISCALVLISLIRRIPTLRGSCGRKRRRRSFGRHREVTSLHRHTSGVTRPSRRGYGRKHPARPGIGHRSRDLN